MTDQITTEELTKAAHNLKRLSEFVGQRRRWSVASGANLAAEDARKAALAIAEMISGMTGEETSAPVSVKQPPKLEPMGDVSASRLTRFSDYLEQLRRWFEAHGGAGLPSDSEYTMRSIQRSLAATGDALGLLLRAEAPKPDPIAKATDEPEALTRGDLGPVAEVDTQARLILEHTTEEPLLQQAKGMVELTPDTRTRLAAFLRDQGIELSSHESRRLEEKVQRWIEVTPKGRVLVLRTSGLSGRPDVISSFQPKDDLGKHPVYNE